MIRGTKLLLFFALSSTVFGSFFCKVPPFRWVFSCANPPQYEKMAHYKGASSEANRAAALLKQREKDREELERLKKKITEDNEKRSGVEKKFSSHFDFVEEQLKSQTIGLVTLQQMKEKRKLVIKDHEKKLAAQLPNENKAGLAEMLKGGELCEFFAWLRLDQKGNKIKKNSKTATLSFDLNDDEEEEEEETEEEDYELPTKKKKVGKDPSVDTSFLPDRDRDELERLERERLRQEWETEQEKLKNEDIEITFSYWDGSGHRRTLRMKKGNSVGQFLSKALKELRKDFPELRGASTDEMMYIKEDLIIPHHFTFYDFIVSHARGKSGPLFNFDVHEDIRLLSDASIEKDESHAGKVVLRGWYERNKHIFPASRWEPYDPEKKWEKYTIRDTVNQ
ncbi:protein FAM50A-like isoform X2 [Oscarella lobularis]|uniref:protein FAM50A-like isoform X2 n=1 Tax=Oscarella lobularis TaxID=121494 RepID=UPI003313F508